MEIWRDIPSYNGLYKVSNFGNVVSLNYGNTKKRKLLKLNNVNGYKNVTLCSDNTKTSFGVHRLVVWAFMGVLSNKNIHVDHKNNNKIDNRFGNLQILTSRENSIKEISKNLPIGVTKVRGKFRARVSINGKPTHLGYFNTPKEARDKYLNRLKQE